MKAKATEQSFTSRIKLVLLADSCVYQNAAHADLHLLLRLCAPPDPALSFLCAPHRNIHTKA
jgi:hypothetical protein